MIEVSELVKDYGSFRAVDHISWNVEPGEIVGFLGPNGAGKTTTIRVLTGFHAATSGTVRVRGFDVVRDSIRVRAGLGYLPENVPIYPDLRVEEYLRFRAQSKGIARSDLRARVEEVMDIAGVTEMRRKLVGHVSRGYRQRVGLADALVGDPPLLILDEPTSGLDPNQRRRVRESIRALRGRHTIVFSSHILADVEEVCDRIILIHRGRLRADDTVERLGSTTGRELRVCVDVADDVIPALFDGLPLTAPRIELLDDGFSKLRFPLSSANGTIDENALLDAIMARVTERGLRLRELYLHHPTLEEIFYNLTEKADEDTAEEQVA